MCGLFCVRIRKVNSFLWLWLVHFLKEDFKAPRVRARLWELLDVAMTRDEQNRVKLLCLQGLCHRVLCDHSDARHTGFSRKQSPAVTPTAVQAAMAREAVAAAAVVAAAPPLPTKETTPSASPSASPGVSRTPSTSSTISSHSTQSQSAPAPAELLRTNSSSSSSTSSSRCVPQHNTHTHTGAPQN